MAKVLGRPGREPAETVGGPGARASAPGWAAASLSGYLLAALATFAALALKLALTEYFGPPYILFYPTVMLASVLGGLGPGLLATGLAASFAAGWVIPEQLHGRPWSTQDLVGLLSFACMGVLMSAVADQSRRARQRVTRYEEERERLEQEALLRKREDLAQRRYELLASHGRDLILFSRREDLRIVEANQAAVAAYGYPREALLGMTVDQLRPPEARDTVAAQLAEADLKGLRFETVHWRQDGSRFPVEVVARGVTLDGTRLMVSVVRDITERRAGEAALAAALAEKQRAAEASERSRSQLEAVFHAVADGVAVADATGTLVLVNEAEARINGFASAEAMKRDLAFFAEVYELTLPDGRPLPVADWPLSRVLRGESLAEVVLRGRRKDTGQTWTFSFSGEPIRGPDGEVALAVVVTRDVTRRTRAEETLQQRERELEEAQRLVHVGSWYASPGADTIEATAELKRLFGLDPQGAFPGFARHRDLLYPAPSWDRLAAAVRETLRTGEPCALEVAATRVDGTPLWVAARGEVVRDGSGAVVGMRGTVQDLTELRRAMEALATERERLAVTLRSIGDAVIATDAQARITDFNTMAETLTGWTAAEALGRPLEEVFRIIGEDTRAPAVSPVARVLREGVVVGLANHTALQARDGTERPIADSGAPIRDANGLVTGVVLVFRDQTEERQAERALAASEERFRQAQKLEGIGRLAGGVAHDFNNLLTVILACSDELQEDLGGGRPTSAEAVEQIRVAGERARDLTRQLLAFARKQVVAPVDLDLDALVAGSQRLLGRLLGEDIDLQVALAGGLWTVHGDAGQLEQVLLNLAVNARDAMPRGGTLRVETSNVLQASGEWVRLAVQDSGEGMAPEVRAHLFEPFFTTKAQGKGTGLGLATVYGVVTQAGGRVEVHSEPGAGTRFEVFLPRARGPAASPPAPEPPPTLTGTEALLLVEDDPQVREVALRALRGGGYQVLVADHPRVALALPDQALRQVQLLVTDVVMPDLDGRSLARELCRRHPALRVLYVSGYTRDAIAERGVLEAGPQLLDKPFTGATLLARVRTGLDAPAWPPA